jgi:hypothetical protein
MFVPHLIISFHCFHMALAQTSFRTFLCVYFPTSNAISTFPNDIVCRKQDKKKLEVSNSKQKIILLNIITYEILTLVSINFKPNLTFKPQK